jgi:hypothetical protein
MKELKDFTIKDLLCFEKMITPQIVTYLYWLGILGSFISGLIVMFTDFSFASFLRGILFFVFGVICSRVFYELVIILFKIYEKLDIIADIKTKEIITTVKKTTARAKTTRAPKKKA